MRNQPDGAWRRVRTMDEARAAYHGCAEILFVKGPRERFDATSFTRVVRDRDFQEPPSDPSSLCAHYLRWLHPRIEFARHAWNDHAALIELWTNGVKLHLFEGSPPKGTNQRATPCRQRRVQTRPHRSSRCSRTRR